MLTEGLVRRLSSHGTRLHQMTRIVDVELVCDLDDLHVRGAPLEPEDVVSRLHGRDERLDDVGPAVLDSITNACPQVVEQV